MKATVDKNGCISCGLCTETCPAVFRIGDDGTAEAYVDEIPKEEEVGALEARDNCPVSVISVE